VCNGIFVSKLRGTHNRDETSNETVYKAALDRGVFRASHWHQVGVDVVVKLSGLPPDPTLFMYIDQGWSPTIAGLVVAWAAGGTTGLRQLLDQALTWRAPLRWYLFVFVGFPGLVFCIWVLTAFVTDATFKPEFLGVGTIVSTFVVVLFGVLGEELFGWRGFALPRLLDRWGNLTASVLLGIGWWVWHQRLLWLLNIPSTSALVFLGIFFLANLGLAIVMTWVYRNTGSALLAGVGLHAAVYFPQFYVSPENIPIPLLNYYLAALLALIVVAVYGTKRFSPLIDE
jgi:membrane protease YdiL (CAAX protease family)